MPTLEQEVATQTAKVQELVDYFNAKKGLIEAAVAAAVAAVPVMEYSFYVDAAAGNDSNDGSLGTPFLTLATAVEKCPVASHCTIYLRASQTHTLDRDVNANAAYINILEWGSLTATPTTIHTGTYDDGTWTQSHSITTSNSLTLAFRGHFKFTFQGKASNGSVWARNRSFLGYFGEGDIKCVLNASAGYRVNIELNNGQGFLSAHAGGLSASFNAYLVDITLKAGSTDTAMIYNAEGRVLSEISSVTIAIGCIYSENNSKLIGVQPPANI